MVEPGAVWTAQGGLPHSGLVMVGDKRRAVSGPGAGGPSNEAKAWAARSGGTDRQRNCWATVSSVSVVCQVKGQSCSARGPMRQPGHRRPAVMATLDRTMLAGKVRVAVHRKSSWPKELPQLSAEQERIRDDFMRYWHEVLQIGR